MLLKKRYLFLILIICLFAVSTVSAEEINNGTDMIANSHDSLISESVDENFLSESYGTFEELQEEINAVEENGTLNLGRNYKYSNGSNEGIQINKAITIDGQGHTLDGDKLSRIFYVNADNVVLKNINLPNGVYSTHGGGIYWSGDNGTLSGCSFVNCSMNASGYTSGLAVYWGGDNGILSGCSFVNCSSDNKYAETVIRWSGDNGTLSGCSFVNCSSNRCGGIYWSGDNGTLSGCSFMNCSAFTNGNAGRGGAVWWNSINGNIIDCSFINCFVFHRSDDYYDMYWGEGGAINVFWCNCVLSNCSFVNCSSSEYGGAIYLDGGVWDEYGMERCDCYEISLIDCSFVNCSSSKQGDAIYWEFPCGIISNCSFENLGSIFLINDEYNTPMDIHALLINNSTFNIDSVYSIGSTVKVIINNSWFNDDAYFVVENGASLILIKRITELYANDFVCDYRNATFYSTLISNKNLISNKEIIFNFTKGNINKIFKIPTNNVGVALLSDELNSLDIGVWNVSVFFEGNNNYYPSNATAKLTVLPHSTSLTIYDVNTTVGHETTLIANVISNSAVNEGTVNFFDGKTNIGEANVVDGKATLTYTPTTAGEHAISAIFNSNNYLSSNDTCKLLVDSATVNVLVDSGVVGFNSNFVANVKGLYSTVNEGNVKFYVDNEYLGKVPVVNGYASINYVPLIVGDYSVNVIYCDSNKYLDDEDSADYHVSKADTKTIVNDLKGTVGHDVTITSTVTSLNKITINEGTVTFFDGKNQIGESQVTKGKATITYTPTTAGEHTITAIFNSDNYLSSNDTSILSVKKANIGLTIADIAPVLFTNPSNFAVNVNSNYKAVNEGKIKYYVNNDLVGTVNVNNGVATLNYIAQNTGNYNLKAVFDETDNYLSSDATSTFKVIKMPTTLSGNSVIFDDDDIKSYTTSLIDKNNNGVNDKEVTIIVIKYSGEYSYFKGTTDSLGISTYDINSLKGGMWYVSGSFDGDDNYINSSFSDKFIVIKVETTTNIEEIDNPQVNHTYKLKANIHDEDGKLVKEGIVQFYLDGVNIGSIDLSKHELKSNNDLLGASNPIFDYKLGDDEEPYLEYTPTKAGTYTLSAVYEGTTIYKTSNYTTDFIVSEGNEYNLSAPDVTKYYGGSERFIVTLNDLSGNPIKNALVKITINGPTYSRTTDENGMASLALNLNSGEYDVVVNYENINVTSKVTVLSTINGNDVVKMYKNDTQYYATFLDSSGNYLSKDTSVKLNLNGIFYEQKIIDNKGTAKLDINEKPGQYILTAINPVTGESAANTIIVLPTIVENNDLVKYYNESTKFSVRVLSPTGNPASGAKVKFTIQNNVYEATSNSNGYAFLDAILQPGNYMVTTSYNGLEVNNTIKILPTLYDKDLKVSSSDIYVGETEIIKVVLPKDATGKVSTNINGKEYSANVNNGAANIIISGLNYGNYDIEVIYSGDSHYNSIKNKTSFMVDKTVDLFAPDVTKYYGGSERFIVTLKDLSGNPIKNAVVKITINGRTSEKVTDDNGIASMGINLNSGEYITTTEYNGTKVNSTVTVKDTVIAKDFSKIFRNGTQYQGTFVDSQGNLIRNTDIEININGVFYTRKTNDNGVAQMNINLPPGTYILTATNPLSKEQHTTKVTVLPNIVENHDLTKYYKNASQYSLRLLDDKGNPVGAGVSIQLNINGVFYTRTSDANGYVKMNINLPPGTYIITAEYKGLRASNTIKVLSVLETKDLVMKYKDGSQFGAKILDGQGRPYAGQTVTFNINGVFYTKTTEADGIARLKINLLAGEYIITSMYNGLNAANKVTISG